MPRRGSLTRGLPVVSFLAAALMVLAAINLVVVFVLLNAQQPDSTNFLPDVAIGALPFLGTAVLIAWTVLATRAETAADDASQQTAARLVAICGVGLLLMVVCGFWAGLFAAGHLPPPGSSAAVALYIYQYALVAAVLADALTLALALVTRVASR